MPPKSENSPVHQKCRKMYKYNLKKFNKYNIKCWNKKKASNYKITTKLLKYIYRLDCQQCNTINTREMKKIHNQNKRTLKLLKSKMEKLLRQAMQ